MAQTLQERFWEKVCPEPNTGCWLWMGGVDIGGYGYFHLSNPKRLRKAHRIAYLLLVGPIPENLCLDHKCRVRSCVNPTHLDVVTIGENLARGVGAPARNARKTHCPHGHAYTPDNIYWHGNSRKCLTCKRPAGTSDAARLRSRLWRERRRVA